MSISQHIGQPEHPQYASVRRPDRGLPGWQLAEISRRMVGIHRRHFGRGPTRTKAHFDGELLVVVLGEVLTPVERLLVAAGMDEKVIELRALAWSLQQAELESAIAGVLARPARLTASQVLPDCDIGMHVFALEPAN